MAVSRRVVLLPFLPLVLLSALSASVSSKPVALRTDYYAKTCPDFQKIVREIVTPKQVQQPTTAAGTLRLFFHDCFLEGCDASVLIATNSFNTAERDDDLNESLPGDAFDVITRVKTALELSCPGVVSCADILAQATRDLVVMVGGPYFDVRLGRKDGLVSRAHMVRGNMPMPNMTVDQMFGIFQKNGFSLREMVALSGAHTIGFSHCKEFSDRLFKYSSRSPTDPELNPRFAAALKDLCKNYTVDDTIAAFNDVMTPGKFDNMYFKNLRRGLGLLASDHILVKDKRTKQYVRLYAANQTAFFEDFVSAMEKLGAVGVKGDGEGEVRRRCDHFNTLHV